MNEAIKKLKAIDAEKTKKAFIDLFKTYFLKDSSYRSLLTISIIVLAIGTFSYSYLERWSFVDSLYFSVITLTTIGYGDLSPQTVEGKLFTIFYIFIGIGIILSFINTVTSTTITVKKQKVINLSPKYLGLSGVGLNLLFLETR